MKKLLLTGIILGMTTLFVGCGNSNKEPEVSQAYLDYISQAKVEIVNEDYAKAEKFLTLAYDENQEDKVVLELREQLDMFNRLRRSLNDPTALTPEELTSLVEEARDYANKEYTTNLLVSDILEMAENLDTTVAVSNETESVLSDLEFEFYNKVNEEKYDEALEIADRLMTELDNYENINGVEYVGGTLETVVNNEVENIKLKKNLEQRREQYPGHFENLMSLMQSEIDKIDNIVKIEESLDYGDSNDWTYIVEVFFPEPLSRAGATNKITFKILGNPNRTPSYFNIIDMAGEETRIEL